jgi:D-alanyl-lipoteichoic acid acyltransferase DltB (MBOAT superfamily)
LLIGISVVAGVGAKLIQSSTSPGARKTWLVVGVIVCLAALAYFKYASFLLTNLLALWGWVAPLPRIPITSPLLPLGISFFVFHAISLLAKWGRRSTAGRMRHREGRRQAALVLLLCRDSSAGPKTTPASISPMTFGCRSVTNNVPSN